MDTLLAIVLIGGVGMGAFGGMAGLDGMLRRHLYVDGEFNTLMILAAICGTMVRVAWFHIPYFNIVYGPGKVIRKVLLGNIPNPGKR